MRMLEMCSFQISRIPGKSASGFPFSREMACPKIEKPYWKRKSSPVRIMHACTQDVNVTSPIFHDYHWKNSYAINNNCCIPHFNTMNCGMHVYLVIVFLKSICLLERSKVITIFINIWPLTYFKQLTIQMMSGK